MKMYKKIITGMAIALLAIISYAVINDFVMHRPSYRTMSLKPDRGLILDCNGNVLVANETVYDIHVDFMVVDDDTLFRLKSRELADEIVHFLPNRSADEWYLFFQENRKKGMRYVQLVNNVPLGLKESLCSLPLLRDGKWRGGCIVSAQHIRQYPYGVLARRTLGYHKAYASIGIDGKYHDLLAGTPGSVTVARVKRFGRLHTWEKERVEAVNGENITLTIDINMQAKADSAYRKHIAGLHAFQGGCLVIMEISTGAIKAMVNLDKDADGNITERFNYAIAMCYYPGAVLSPFIPWTKGNSEKYRSLFLPDSLDFDIDGLSASYVPDFPFDMSGDNNGPCVMVSPLSILSAYNTVMNNGTMLKPHLIVRPDGRQVLGDQLFSAQEAEAIKPAIRQAMGYSRKKQDNIGQGYEYYHTYAGYYPHDTPKYTYIMLTCTGKSNMYL